MHPAFLSIDESHAIMSQVGSGCLKWLYSGTKAQRRPCSMSASVCTVHCKIKKHHYLWACKKLNFRLWENLVTSCNRKPFQWSWSMVNWTCTLISAAGTRKSPSSCSCEAPYTLDTEPSSLYVSMRPNWRVDFNLEHRSRLSGVLNWNGLVVARLVHLYQAFHFFWDQTQTHMTESKITRKANKPTRPRAPGWTVFILIGARLRWLFGQPTDCLF